MDGWMDGWGDVSERAGLLGEDRLGLTGLMIRDVTALMLDSSFTLSCSFSSHYDLTSLIEYV